MSEDPESGLFLLFLVSKLWASVSFYGLFGVLLLVLLLCSALISASEVAFFSLRQPELKECTYSSKRCDKHLLALLSRPQRFLATILIVNNVVNIAFVTLSTFVAWRIMGTNTLAGQFIIGLTALVTLCIVLFGEIIPKVYATQHALRYARRMALVLYYLDSFLAPTTVVFTWLHKQLTKRIRRKGYDYSAESLQQAIDIAAKHNTSKEEEGMLRGIMHFSSIPVKDIMQPRAHIVALSKEEDFPVVLAEVHTLRYARVPVYNETLDKIEGILYRKDLLPHLQERADFAWQKLLRTPYFVPENRKIGALFRDFQKKRVHMAIVVDEYGGTSGLVTMEDVIEEIVGDIRDENAGHHSHYKELNPRTYIFEAKISMLDFCKALRLSATFFDDVRSESRSLGGLMLELHGKMPHTGTKLTYEHISFTILTTDDKRIKTVRVGLPAVADKKYPKSYSADQALHK